MSINLAQHIFEILLVEDSPADADLFRQLIPGPHHVTVAENGAEALDRLFQRGRFEKSIRPDIVVVDLNLPLLSGHELINTIKSNSSLRSIPVVVLSASARHDDVKKAYDLGAGAYIVKSFELADMEKKLSIFANFWCGQVLYARFAGSSAVASAI